MCLLTFIQKTFYIKVEIVPSYKCNQKSSSPTASNNNKWFTVEHNGCLANGGSYYIRVTTGVKDGSGISMDDNDTTGTGFGTNKLSCP